MKKEVSQSATQSRPKMERPVLKRLGTLRDLTCMIKGGGSDGGMFGMSFP